MCNPLLYNIVGHQKIKVKWMEKLVWVIFFLNHIKIANFNLLKFHVWKFLLYLGCIIKHWIVNFFPYENLSNNVFCSLHKCFKMFDFCIIFLSIWSARLKSTSEYFTTSKSIFIQFSGTVRHFKTQSSWSGLCFMLYTGTSTLIHINNF